MKRVWWVTFGVLIAALLAGCSLAQPGTPSATWEPFPTLSELTGAATVEPTRVSPTVTAPTEEPPTAASTPTTTALPPTQSAAINAIHTPLYTWTLQPTETIISAPTEASLEEPSHTATQAPTSVPTTTPTVAPTATAAVVPTTTFAPTSTATVVPTTTSVPTAAATANPAPTSTPDDPPSSELVMGWVGTVVDCASGQRNDDCFLVEGTGAQYGIHSLVSRLQTQLAAARQSSARIRIWGVLDYGVDDHTGRRITVTRLELVRE